ncbi:MAG TPA: hypothetical protein VFJ95_09605 [Gammaproteobacteria bacterium]|jgi:hypothetical protein|nr:hypothetical protein [Gammaproteobacteria bacterium]
MSPSSLHSRDPHDPAVAARIRASAWLLGALAAAVFLGYIAWNYLGGPL